MPDYPAIAVIIPTYNRSEIVKTAVTNLHKYLHYNGPIRYYIGMDGNDDTEARIKTLFPDVHCLPGPKRGLGANLNRLLKFSSESYFIQMDDDHILLSPLDLNKHMERLQSHFDDGWIRLMGIGSHHYAADLDGDYWRVRWDSPELYIPSNRPHLKKRAFHEHYGYYPENIPLGATEEGFCGRCKEIALSSGGPAVLVPLNSQSETQWDHIGDSWQLKGL